MIDSDEHRVAGRPDFLHGRHQVGGRSQVVGDGVGDGVARVVEAPRLVRQFGAVEDSAVPGELVSEVGEQAVAQAVALPLRAVSPLLDDALLHARVRGELVHAPPEQVVVVRQGHVQFHG